MLRAVAAQVTEPANVLVIWEEEWDWQPEFKADLMTKVHDSWPGLKFRSSRQREFMELLHELIGRDLIAS